MGRGEAWCQFLPSVFVHLLHHKLPQTQRFQTAIIYYYLLLCEQNGVQSIKLGLGRMALLFSVFLRIDGGSSGQCVHFPGPRLRGQEQAGRKLITQPREKSKCARGSTELLVPRLANCHFCSYAIDRNKSYDRVQIPAVKNHTLPLKRPLQRHRHRME